MELVKGRPTDCSGRLEREVRVYDLLDKLGIEYERTDHEKANTMEKCNEIDKILDTIICKNLFLCNRQQTEFYLLMMPGDKPVVESETLGCHPCVCTSSLKFKTKDIIEKFLPAVHHEPIIVDLPWGEE